MRTAISPRLAIRTEPNIWAVLAQGGAKRHDEEPGCPQAYCLALGLSESGAAPSDFFAGGRRPAEVGAVLVGRGSGAGAAACAGGLFAGGGACACGGSLFMMLTGGI